MIEKKFEQKCFYKPFGLFFICLKTNTHPDRKLRVKFLEYTKTRFVSHCSFWLMCQDKNPLVDDYSRSFEAMPSMCFGTRVWKRIAYTSRIPPHTCEHSNDRAAVQTTPSYERATIWDLYHQHNNVTYFVWHEILIWAHLRATVLLIYDKIQTIAEILAMTKPALCFKRYDCNGCRTTRTRADDGQREQGEVWNQNTYLRRIYVIKQIYYIVKTTTKDVFF